MKWKFIPTKTINFHTPLSKQEVMERLKSALQQRVGGYRFEGEIGESDFKLWEIVPVRSNSFLPTLTGAVLPDENGSTIRVVLRLNGCAWAFVLVWCYPFALVMFLAILSVFREGFSRIDIGSITFILFFPGVMIMMTTLGFRRGVRSAREFLTEVFQ